MAITPTITTLQPFGDEVHIISWDLTGPNESGESIEMPGSSIRSVQIDGTFNGSTCLFEGSNDGVTWFTLTNPQGVAISTSADSLDAIQELTRFVRPTVTGLVEMEITILLLVKKVR